MIEWTPEGWPVSGTAQRIPIACWESEQITKQCNEALKARRGHNPLDRKQLVAAKKHPASPSQDGTQ